MIIQLLGAEGMTTHAGRRPTRRDDARRAAAYRLASQAAPWNPTPGELRHFRKSSHSQRMVVRHDHEGFVSHVNFVACGCIKSSGKIKSSRS
jgi:hypothetical protein